MRRQFKGHGLFIGGALILWLWPLAVQRKGLSDIAKFRCFGNLRRMELPALTELRDTVARLRAPDGCPWDREQTPQSLCRCLVDEVSELLDTIDRGDWPHMREELGDVLLQVVMQAQIAHEEGHFDFNDVAADINAKLIRRHPHVFGQEAQLGNSEAVLKRWDEIKAAEKKHSPEGQGPFKHLPPQLPALLYAWEIYKQAIKKELPVGEVLDEPTVTQLADGLTEASAGQRLMELVAACRVAGIDPESALRRAASRVRNAL